MLASASNIGVPSTTSVGTFTFCTLDVKWFDQKATSRSTNGRSVVTRSVSAGSLMVAG